MNRFKNYGFWLGIIATVLAAAQIDPQTLTSWELLKEAVLNVVKNPYLVGCVIVAILGQFNNPTTEGKGFLDD